LGADTDVRQRYALDGLKDGYFARIAVKDEVINAGAYTRDGVV